jgi:hypothetical protein
MHVPELDRIGLVLGPGYVGRHFVQMNETTIYAVFIESASGRLPGPGTLPAPGGSPGGSGRSRPWGELTVSTLEFFSQERPTETQTLELAKTYRKPYDSHGQQATTAETQELGPTW